MILKCSQVWSPGIKSTPLFYRGEEGTHGDSQEGPYSVTLASSFLLSPFNCPWAGDAVALPCTPSVVLVFFICASHPCVR